MNTIKNKIFLLLPLVALLLAAGCSESDSLYGLPENIPDKLHLYVSVNESDVITFNADSSNVGVVAPIIFSWTPAEARGVEVEYLFMMDLTDAFGSSAFREELGAGVYERIIRPDMLFRYLHSVWKIPVNETVMLNVAVVAPIYSAVYMKPESSVIQIPVRLIE
jgi:hypothetical protein